MPVEFLTTTQRETLSRFPSEISQEDLLTCFTLTAEDVELIVSFSGSANQRGFAVVVSELRYLGFIPSNLKGAPGEAGYFLADQIGADSKALESYGGRPKSIREHQVKAIEHLGYGRAAPQDLRSIEEWLVERALEHDRPSVLIEAACEKLRHERLACIRRSTVFCRIFPPLRLRMGIGRRPLFAAARGE